jgi:hypothetical protein
MTRKNSDLHEFEEMVAARSKIQAELIEVLRFKRTYGDMLKASAFLRVTGLLASTGFSLRRAAFLFTHAKGKHDDYLRNVETFISKVISDYNIGFSDDKNTWSLWHYIGVARSSLLEASELLSTRIETAKFSAMRAKLIDAPLLPDSAAQQWDLLFVMMKMVRETCAAQIKVLESL